MKDYENYQIDKQNNLNRPSPQSKQKYLNTVTSLLTQEELIELQAFAVCRNGFFSYGLPEISRYLNLTSQQRSSVINIINRFNTDIDSEIDKQQNLQLTNKGALKKRVVEDKLPGFIDEISNTLPVESKVKLKRLNSIFDMELIIDREISRKINESLNAASALESIRNKPLNLMKYFNTNLVVVSNNSDFQKLLNMDLEQSEKIEKLYQKYIDAVDEFQQTYIIELRKSKRDPTVFFSEIAIKLNMESENAMARLLNDQQRSRLTQIKYQMFGASLAFEGKIAADIGITDEQQSNLLGYLVKLKREHVQLFDQWKNDRDGAYLSKQFISNKLLNNYLTKSQRDIWTKSIGDKIPDEVLKRLSMLQSSRTRLHY